MANSAQRLPERKDAKQYTSRVAAASRAAANAGDLTSVRAKAYPPSADFNIGAARPKAASMSVDVRELAHNPVVIEIGCVMAGTDHHGVLGYGNFNRLRNGSTRRVYRAA